VFVCGKPDFKLNLLINNFVKKSSKKYSVRTRGYINWWVEFYNPGIIFVQNLEDLPHLFKYGYYSRQAFHTSAFLIYIRKNEIKFYEKFDKIVKPIKPDGHGWGHISQFAYFLIDDGSKLELKTFEWWTEKSCDQTQLVDLNSYNYKTRKWKVEFKIFEKFTNFHNCTLKYFSRFFHIYTLEIIIKLNLMAFAEMMNPKITMIVEKRDITDQEMRSIFAKIGNFSFEVDENSPQILQYPSWFSSGECSMDFYKSPAVSMYSPPDPYTNYEKMLLPFDAITWTLMSISFIATFCGAFMIQFLSESQKKLLISKNGNSNSINVMAIFFGDSQRNMPENNFVRIILMTFVMVFFIMRNAYQSEYFFLKKKFM
jgi:hypothetical protein